MRHLAMALLGAVALAVCTGCTAGTFGAPTSLAGETVRDCSRSGGTYNRAADLCVGGGGP